MNAGEEAALLEAAAELFNRGEHLAAHEVLDDLWEATEGPDADFYKGLIQASVALHHLGSGNVEGAQKLERGMRKLLAAYLPEHRGVALTPLLETLRARLRGDEGVEVRIERSC